jgi:hypothetical protein
MIPFLSSASYETTQFAKALIEPMYYEYPKEKEAYKCRNQYLFGGQLLVRPVTHKGDRYGIATEQVWLPAGRWVDIFTGDEYEGGRVVEMARWADSSPTLLREGGIFVLDGRETPMDIAYPDVLRVLSTCGDGAYILHEGEKDCWAHTRFETHKVQEGEQRLTFTCDDGDFLPTRTFCIDFLDILTGEAHATANGVSIPCQVDDRHHLTVKIENVVPGITYEVVVQYKKCDEGERDARLFDSLRRLEGHNLSKMALWDEMKGKTKEERAALISASSLFSKRGKKRLLEVLYSV